MTFPPTLAAAALVLAAGLAFAQSTGQTASPSTAAYEAINAQMHHQMNVAFTGDADVDFTRAMIPHHQGAVDMAKVVLEYGSDPEVRKLAEAVIAAQEQEIAWMQAWLKARGY